MMQSDLQLLHIFEQLLGNSDHKNSALKGRKAGRNGVWGLAPRKNF